MNPKAVSPVRVCLAWSVHAYTGSGLALGAWIAALLLEPARTPDTYRTCFLLMLAAVLVDATDGTLARAIRIREVVPGFDGRRLDDLVDFLLYTCLPLVLIDRAGLLPEGSRWVLVVALVASAYGFCQADIKTADGAFLGFPSYWNIVAFYLFALPVTGAWAVALIAALAALTFVPSRYAYPTQPGRGNRVLLVLGVPWALVLLAAMVPSWEDGPPRALVRASLLYPVLYLASAWSLSLYRAVSRASRPLAHQ
ncbi:CDP-alcohol phosphatidyltransferase [Gemmata sp. JC673]|uniref:CDP-alcohol phosphatidyltransferase n=1 Tax=Gemmata algarum TaxID=2975278 RepID=A0ABU5F3Q3_9BACT|nr:CDP-alcohol phosphatidyltransferase [Gemmata algarum]MDY3561773.1 CDP-alcohol phosphatidyltransferase [Gemmata algarum]